MTTLDINPGEHVQNVHFTKYNLSVDLVDGRTVIVPLVWYPRLLHATPEQRANWRVCGGGFGIHWPDIDEDLSTEGLLRGAPAPRQSLLSMKKATEPAMAAGVLHVPPEHIVPARATIYGSTQQTANS